jgi:hypothetical protein
MRLDVGVRTANCMIVPGIHRTPLLYMQHFVAGHMDPSRIQNRHQHGLGVLQISKGYERHCVVQHSHKGSESHKKLQDFCLLQSRREFRKGTPTRRTPHWTRLAEAASKRRKKVLQTRRGGSNMFGQRVLALSALLLIASSAIAAAR